MQDLPRTREREDDAAIGDVYELRSAHHVAARAADLVDGERAAAYGDECMERWAVVLGGLFGWDADAHRCAIALAALKLVREGHAPKDDNRIDAIGYVLLADRELHRDRGD